MDDKLPQVHGDTSGLTNAGDDSRWAVRRRILELIDEHPDEAETLTALLDDLPRESNWLVWRNWYLRLGSKTFTLDDVHRVFSQERRGR